MTSICLNMIVKNESHVITKTLENILDQVPITYWVIADTGSTDNTKEMIQAFFDDRQIPGELLDHEWVNFGHNRQQVLEAAQDKTDYVFFFDADDRIEGQLPLPDFKARGYYFILRDEDDSTQYHRPLLVKNDGSFYWRAVLHEYLLDRKGETYTIIEGDYVVRSCRTGGRSLEPDKYKKDALVLEKALEDGIDPDLTNRYMFYAAQSWMAAGDSEKGAYWYHKRAEAGGWDQELYVAHYRLGLHYGANKEDAKAIYHWLCGAEAFPRAVEPWYQLSRINSWSNRHKVAYTFAKRAVEAVDAGPGGYLFQNKDIVQYWAYYELFMNAFYHDKLADSYYALKGLIKRDAPSWLYTNELDKVEQLRPYALADTYTNIKELLDLLKEKDLDNVRERLGL